MKKELQKDFKTVLTDHEHTREKIECKVVFVFLFTKNISADYLNSTISFFFSPDGP